MQEKKSIDPARIQRALDTYTHEDGDCLIWTGRLSKSSGHPKLGELVMRRAVWELKNGPLEPKQLVTCTCGRNNCLEHLALTTRQEIATKANADPRVKAIKRIKSAKWARANAKKLSMEKAQEIRDSADNLPTEAKKWGISKDMVHKIRTGKAWVDLKQSSYWAGLGAR